MRCYFGPILLLMVALCGCKSAQKEGASGEAPPQRTATARTIDPKPVVRPADIINGRVITVQERYQFVVIDFVNSRVPVLDQRLSVYRLDQKVAEVKVSGPYLGTTVAADIIAGNPKTGDLVRSP